VFTIRASLSWTPGAVIIKRPDRQRNRYIEVKRRDARAAVRLGGRTIRGLFLSTVVVAPGVHGELFFVFFFFLKKGPPPPPPPPTTTGFRAGQRSPLAGLAGFAVRSQKGTETGEFFGLKVAGVHRQPRALGHSGARP